MALAQATYSSNQTNAVLVAGVAGKRIRVTRLNASFQTNGTLDWLAAPGGAGQAALLPTLYLAAHTPIDLVFGSDGGVVTAAGDALGLTSALDGPSRGQGVMVWYELVD